MHVCCLFYRASAVSMHTAHGDNIICCNNAIFGKIGRLASGEVILQLLFVSKCMPMLLVCRQLSSLDFAINRYFMKLFQTNNIKTARACQENIRFELPSVLLNKRTES